MSEPLQTLIFGIVTGSYLVVATLGFALVARLEGFLNIAHAELISAGAFITYALNANAGWPLAAAAAVAVISVTAVAPLVYRLLYRPMRGASAVTLLIASVGVTYVLHGITASSVGPGVYSLRTGLETLYDLGPVSVGQGDLVIIAAAIASVAVVHLILTRTTTGLQWRALASNHDLAAGRGIDRRAASLRIWALVGALAGLAGVLLGLQGTITTDISFGQILLIIGVSLLAGLGSIYGVVIAALLLGVAMDMSTLVLPAGYRDAVAFGVILLVLVVRPEGLAGSTLARREA